MSNYKSLIDEAMKTARYRLDAGVDKTASAPGQSSLVKEASELANALEYMSMTNASDGSVAGSARAEMIRDFHKAANSQRLGVKLAGTVGDSPTMTSGEQAQAPESGKTKLMPKKMVNGQPMVTQSPDAKGNAMLESYKQADSAQTLYDILMHQKEAKREPVSEADMKSTKNWATGLGWMGAAGAAPKGRKVDAALGSAGGSMVGGTAGMAGGAAIGAGLGSLGGAKGRMIGAGIGSMLGLGGGSMLGSRKGTEMMLNKEAGDVGEMSASDSAQGIPSSNENSNRALLADASILAGVSKQEAKAPTRARLAEAFASTNDTLGDQTVKALFPQAFQGGGLKKVANASSTANRLRKLME